MSEAAADLAAIRGREYRRMVALSAALHVALSVLAVVSLPSPFDDGELPAGPMIEMITEAELAALTNTPAPAPKPKAEPKPEPVAQPEPPPPPPADQIIIPEDTTQKPAKPKPKPKPEPVREVETRTAAADEAEQVDLEEFLLEQRILEGEMPGKAKPDAKPQVVPGAGGTGAPDSPEVAAWKAKVRAHIKRNWSPAQFRGKRLETRVTVTLTESGRIVSHAIERKSGNPWFDENVERYLESEDALPPPPRADDWLIIFDGDL